MITSGTRHSGVGRRPSLAAALMTVAALGISLISGAPATADTQDAPQGGDRWGTRAAEPAPAWPDGGAGATTARQMAQLRDEPAQLKDFLREMPKGGDLHTHLSGAVPTESLIDFAAKDGLCIDKTMTAVQPPCANGARPAQNAVNDKEFRQELVRAWSMEGFRETPEESGHQHFFAAFDKFAAVTHAHRGRLLAAVSRTAAEQHQSYVEPLFTPRGSDLNALANTVSWDSDLDRMRQKLLAGDGMETYLTGAGEDTDGYLDEYYTELGCASENPEPACAVEVRFDFQVGRTYDPKYVFTQLLAGFMMAENNPYFVGVNLVQAEDNPVALRDYRLQMKMIKYLKSVYPTARVTLHAGELTPKLAPADDLRFHIRDAVETAGAERIGHGVGILDEDRPEELLSTMAKRKVAVEVPLTSNCQILTVCGATHPLRRYLEAGVPVALSTDDQGVSRITITDEYRRATTEHRATYQELKASARASLDHAFIQGASLWRGPGDYRPGEDCAGSDPSAGKATSRCRAMLDESPKAALQWELEKDLADFEARQTARS